jgi:hypothetical protein
MRVYLHAIVLASCLVTLSTVFVEWVWFLVEFSIAEMTELSQL